MADEKPEKIIIEGITEAGEKFRPSDWAERMSGNLSTFKRRRIYYSPMLQPVVKGGNKCVMLDPALKESNPALYDSILEFAQSNKLRICRDDEMEVPHHDTDNSLSSKAVNIDNQTNQKEDD